MWCCSCFLKSDMWMWKKWSLCKLLISPRKGANVEGGQIPGATHLHLLDTVQLHHAQDFHNIVHWHWNNLQLLTPQVDGRFSLLHPPEDADEEVVQGPSLQAKFYKNIHWSQVLLCCWPVLSHWCHSWAWAPITAGSRPQAPDVLASIT